MKLDRKIGVVVCVLASAAGMAGAQTATIVADRDNTLFQMSGLPDLSSGRGDLFTGGISQQDAFGNAYKRRALLHFSTATIPAGATITSATLTMRMTKTIGGSYQFDLHRMLADWGEGTSNSGTQGTGVAPSAGDATWNYRFFGDTSSAWTTPGGDFDPAISGSKNIDQVGSYSWASAGMVTDIQGWLNGSSPNYGWALTANLEFLTSIAKRFASRENGTASFRPTLVVGYTVPAPGVGAVAAIGLTGLGLRRRRAQ